MRTIYKTLIITIFIFLISSCGNSAKVAKTKNLVIHDIAPGYNITHKKLTVYKFDSDTEMSYVNISEFIDDMEGGIVNLNINKSDVMNISYTFDVPKEYQDVYGGPKYTYEMIINPKTNVISVNDFDMFQNLNPESNGDYQSNLKLSKVETDKGNSSVDIDLSNYGFKIVLSQNNYYIPLSLANLFFTGPYLNVYEMNNDLYVFDSESDLNQLESHFKINNNLKASNISSETEDYLALYFDYFYGLKEYKQVDSYKPIIEQYDLKSQQSVDDMNKKIESFIGSLNDLHTSIISSGYMDTNFTSSTADNIKTKNYINAYDSNSCEIHKEDVEFQSINDQYAVILVNKFTADTANLLKPVMEKAKNYDNIVIDVSCNPGGDVISAVELLRYMTNNDIPVHYIDSTTGIESTEYYTSTDKVALNKNFFVYTSAATYSAANLFVSIVKDMNLATIIGTKTGGGASTITYTVLPDGAIIVNSSDMTFENKQGIVIEDGISETLPYERSIWYGFDQDLENIYRETTGMQINKSFSDHQITYDFKTESNSNIQDATYTVTITDKQTKELIDQQSYTQNEFSYTIDKPQQRAYSLKISVNCKYNGGTLNSEIYHDIVDDHEREINSHNTEIPLGKDIEAYSYNEDDDSDTFKFTISEKGVYQIDSNKDYIILSIYNPDGSSMIYDSPLILEPGTYYLTASHIQTGEYTLNIHSIQDDTLSPTSVNLEPGTSVHSLNVDYVSDKESFEFHVEKNSLVTFSWDLPTLSYYIVDSNGKNIMPVSHLQGPTNVILPKGIYYMYLINPSVGKYSLTSTVMTDYQDYADSMSDTTNFGTLVLGNNTVNFLTNYDKDIYTIDITEKGNYYFLYNTNQGKVIFNDLTGLSSYLAPNDRVTLEPGKYYFQFESKNSELNPNVVFTFKKDDDINTEDNMGKIVPGITTTAVVSKYDSNYFVFTSGDTSTYKFTILGNYEAYAAIYDENGNHVISGSNSFYFTVPKGTYTIIVGLPALSHDNNLETIYLTIGKVEDEALNTTTEPIDNYQLIDKGRANCISGEIQYDGDKDVYIIEINEDGYYHPIILSNLSFNISIGNETHSTQTWKATNPIYLEKGTYFVSISSDVEGAQYMIGYDKTS